MDPGLSRAKLETAWGPTGPATLESGAVLCAPASHGPTHPSFLLSASEGQKFPHEKHVLDNCYSEEQNSRDVGCQKEFPHLPIFPLRR